MDADRKIFSVSGAGLVCANLACARAEWVGGRPSRFEDVTLAVPPGQLAGFCGPEGCGKGLLLHVLGLLEPPDAGTLWLDGQDLLALGAAERARIRNFRAGFIFEMPALLPSFTVLENLAMPLFRLRDLNSEEASGRVRWALEFCGAWEVHHRLAGRLKPEEAAAVAVARALVHSPRMVVAINPPSPALVFRLLGRAVRELGILALAAGSAERLARVASTLHRMEAGRLVR